MRKSDANIAKINEVQEQQAKAGLNNYLTFKNRVNKAIMYLGCNGFAYSLVGLALGYIISTHQSYNLIEFISGFVVITIFALLPSLYRLVKNKSKVGEFDKIKYRDENIEKLKKYIDYENALAG